MAGNVFEDVFVVIFSCYAFVFLFLSIVSRVTAARHEKGHYGS